MEIAKAARCTFKMCNPVIVEKARERQNLASEFDQGGCPQVTHISSAHAKDTTIRRGKIARTCSFFHS